MKLPDAPVFKPAPYTIETARALKAIAAGTASPEQQKTGLNWICEKAGGFFDDAMQPGMPDATHYMSGRRSVTIQIRHILQVKIHNSEKETE
ncbi:MAG: hypothetical protein AB7O39_03190 [Flavobacteriaceae bacterium]